MNIIQHMRIDINENENTMNSFTTTVKEADDGELYIEFPPELMESLGWAEGDTLDFAVQDDGSILIKKIYT
jgi:bifunctional DNA-binding transcriptional regulator/antitoxin component of YhaV-PrlF toxin-antitoxin module